MLLVDLDNTLIDRAGAVDRWAREFASAHGGDAEDAEWLAAADRDGLEPRERFARMIAERFGLDAQDEGAMLAELRGGLVRQLVPDDAVTRALRRARAAGWAPFVVTNGTVAQQERKLRHTGLDREVAGWIVSEGAGLPGVWLHRGRPWPLTAFAPGHVADSFPHAVDLVLRR
jgi:putative hydrolase of the HAD superfamily